MVSASTRAFGSPSRYIQGPGEFDNLPDYTGAYGQGAFCLIDGFLFDSLGERLARIYPPEAHCIRERFSGECCHAEIDRVMGLARQNQSGVFVAVGGGKTIDTGKMVANELGLPLIVVPTSASTDAPTSAMSIVYTEHGEYIGSKRHRRNPEMVVLDTQIIAKAPIRLFISGMGDALATYFEAKANEASDSANFIGKGYRRCKAGMAIARMAYDILMADGRKALRALEGGVCTEAVENVIEANTLLSGLGFENVGCAAAHGIHAGLTEIPSTHRFYHGEKVTFGIICQLVLENARSDEFEQVIRFCIDVGLPVTLAQLDVDPTHENIRIIAHKVAVDNSLIRSEPFLITESLVHDAIIAANEIGKHYLKQRQA